MPSRDRQPASAHHVDPDREHRYRHIPSVNDLVDAPRLEQWSDRVSRPLIVAAAQSVLAEHRAALGRANGDAPTPALDDLARRVETRLETDRLPPLPPVINATGIVIHTGLGRAPLAEPAIAAMAAVARGYAPVELDLARGARGRRTDVVRPLLCELTGAESATVVNNTAGAVLLVVTALARERTVIVSRGELIEIGGSFRLPDVMETGGALLREVGTTNKTRLRDYEGAIDGRTGAIMKVHPSNYRVEGFTATVPIADLVTLGHAHGLPVVHDIGSGVLREGDVPSVTGEPDARASIEAGADLVLFSGDKLLGGPQAGIIVGRREWVERIERHPMTRALRVDKLVLAALSVTLQLHRDAAIARRDLPVMAMLAAPVSELERRGRALIDRLRDTAGLDHVALRASESFPGGGSVPGHAIPSVALEIRAGGMAEEDLAARLRCGPIAVVPRVQSGVVVLDLRTVMPHQDADLETAIRSAVSKPA